MCYLSPILVIYLFNFFFKYFLYDLCDCAACDVGFYGSECSRECGNCLNGTACDHVTGTCTSGCADGWKMDRCKDRELLNYFQNLFRVIIMSRFKHKLTSAYSTRHCVSRTIISHPYINKALS